MLRGLALVLGNHAGYCDRQYRLVSNVNQQRLLAVTTPRQQDLCAIGVGNHRAVQKRPNSRVTRCCNGFTRTQI